MVVQSPDNWMAGLILLTLRLSVLLVGLGQHPVHVQNLNTGVLAAGGAQLAVGAESARPTRPLVRRHINGLVERRLRRLTLHFCFKLEIQSRAQLLFSLVLCSVLRHAFGFEPEGDHVHEPVRGGTRWVRVN